MAFGRLRSLVFGSLALVAFAASCSPAASQKADFPAAPRAVGVATYELAWDQPRGELVASAFIPAGLTSSFDIENGLPAFLSDVTVESAGKSRALSRVESGYQAPECMNASCVLRYRLRLREAARSLDDLDEAKLLGNGTVVTSPPPAFILAPWAAPGTTKVRFRVQTSDGASFLTGVFPAKEPGYYEVAMDDLGSAPYSAFGPITFHTIEEPGGQLVVGLVPSSYPVSHEQLFSWVEKSGHAVASYYDGMPMPREAVLLVAAGRGGIGFGKSLAGGGATVFVGVGAQSDEADLKEDWVLTHELIHAAFPAQPRDLDWVEEGLATYVEPIARARVGILSEKEMWRGMVDGLHNGLPEAGDRGIDHTRTWGRTYWGGALFFFLADLQIRRETKGAASLREALIAILRNVSSNAHRGDLVHAFEVGDRATGTHVLTTLHNAWASTPVMVDLESLFKALGVRRGADAKEIVFDDSAPESALRLSLVTRAH